MAKTGAVERQWYVIDAQDMVLGRLASQVASMLRGKHKPCYTPHVDTGDYLVVVNAEKIRVTGNKLADKMYYHHSGYMGGLKTASAKDLLAKKPEEIIRHAVKGMLPKNSLGRAQLSKLKVYRGAEHPHGAQTPKTYTLDQVAQ